MDQFSDEAVGLGPPDPHLAVRGPEFVQAAATSRPPLTGPSWTPSTPPGTLAAVARARPLAPQLPAQPPRLQERQRHDALGRTPVPAGPDGAPVGDLGMIAEHLPEGVGIPRPDSGPPTGFGAPARIRVRVE
ncbi:hypothetical protein [Streptomyces sindenensis]|uniref:Uncharacterized protein n=1 Tax=Streptomyces sindenensis TaxID=67363 RepID=A0ABW6EM67_9ACTN